MKIITFGNELNALKKVRKPLEQCFSTIFGSRNPFRRKKFGGTLMELKQ